MWLLSNWYYGYGAVEVGLHSNINEDTKGLRKNKNETAFKYLGFLEWHDATHGRHLSRPTDSKSRNLGIKNVATIAGCRP